jgi:hypothetical protein
MPLEPLPERRPLPVRPDGISARSTPKMLTSVAAPRPWGPQGNTLEPAGRLAGRRSSRGRTCPATPPAPDGKPCGQPNGFRSGSLWPQPGAGGQVEGATRRERRLGGRANYAGFAPAIVSRQLVLPKPAASFQGAFVSASLRLRFQSWTVDRSIPITPWCPLVLRSRPFQRTHP